MVILHIESSARGRASVSRRLSTEIVDRLASRSAGARVVLRDLAADPLPHVNEAFVHAMFAAPHELTATDIQALARSEELVGELEAASAVVLGAPMYNYAMPSALKAWIDHVVRARRTFQHTPSGPKGLLADRPVWIATACGGIYSAGPAAQSDFLAPYLRAVLGKIGLRSIQFVSAEGVTLGAGPESALASALGQLDSLLPLQKN